MFYKRANLTKSAGFIEESNNMKNLPADNINHGLNKKNKSGLNGFKIRKSNGIFTAKKYIYGNCLMLFWSTV